MTRELIRLAIKHSKQSHNYFIFKEQNEEIRLKTSKILYVKSDGNYIDIFTQSNVYTLRLTISKFLDYVPDTFEFIRVHRSYIVRRDKITSKSKTRILIDESIKIPVSLSHSKKLKHMPF